MDFGIGKNNITATDYLSKTILPALDYSLTQLIEHIIKIHEIDKWKEIKEEEYNKQRRDARRKQRKEAGESVSGSDEWDDSGVRACDCGRVRVLLYHARACDGVGTGACERRWLPRAARPHTLAERWPEYVCT